MEQTVMLPDLQSAVLCEDVRCEFNGMQTLVGVINADAAMSIPQGFHSYAILPIGYPMGRFGPVGRGPLADVMKWLRNF